MQIREKTKKKVRSAMRYETTHFLVEHVHNHSVSMN